MAEQYLTNLDGPDAITKITETSSESIDDAIEASQNTIKTLKYPLKSDDYHACVKFEVFKIVPPQVAEGSLGAFQTTQTASANMKKKAEESRRIDGLTDKEFAEESQYAGKTKEQVRRELAAENEKIRLDKLEAAGKIKMSPRKEERTNQIIKLYLPVAFQQNDTFNIATPELGQVGAAAYTGVAKGSSNLFTSGLSSIGQAATSIIDYIAGNTGDAALLAGAAFAERSGLVPFGAEVGQAAQIAGAITVNPNVRSAFRGVSLREFSFTFKLIARSAAEAEEIKNIIKLFRLTAYPEVIEASGVSVGYKYPNIYQISALFDHKNLKQKRIGSKMRYCYLRSVAVNYNGSSMAFHRDGEPVEVDLALNFIEDQTLSRKDIEEGF